MSTKKIWFRITGQRFIKKMFKWLILKMIPTSQFNNIFNFFQIKLESKTLRINSKRVHWTQPRTKTDILNMVNVTWIWNSQNSFNLISPYLLSSMAKLLPAAFQFSIATPFGHFIIAWTDHEAIWLDICCNVWKGLKVCFESQEVFELSEHWVVFLAFIMVHSIASSLWLAL